MTDAELLREIASRVEGQQTRILYLSEENAQLITQNNDLKLQLKQLTSFSNVLDFHGDWESRWGVEAIGRDLSRTSVINDRLVGFVPANQQKGFGFYADLNECGWGYTNEFTFEYSFYVPVNFQFMNPVTKGGGFKLPGFGGGVDGNPSFIGQGGFYSPQGFSVRFLGHANRDIQAYCYLKSPKPSSGGYGWSPARMAADGQTLKILPGEINTVRVTFLNNTPGMRNGVLQASLNGVQGMNHRSMEYCSVEAPTLQATHLYPGYFHGGGPKDYPTIRNHIELLEFRKVA